MAISQRLVDPFREIRVPISYSWHDPYKAAPLESEIHKRRLELSQRAERSEGSANGCGCLAGAAESEVGSSSNYASHCQREPSGQRQD